MLSPRNISRWFLAAAVVALALSAASPAARAQTLVYSLSSAGLYTPNQPAAIAQGRDGNLYSSARFGGAVNAGGVFWVSPGGTYATLFTPGVGSGEDGFYSGVTLGTDDSYYGAFVSGGASGYGGVFKLSAAGSETVLHSFTGTDGVYPGQPPVQAADGNFYGVSQTTMYKITSAGLFSELHPFTSAEGLAVLAGLVVGTDGNLYGCASQGGGLSNSGTIFKATTAGVITPLHDFLGTDGSSCQGTLVQGADGKLYGTTTSGGTGNDGVIFKITTGGSYSVLYNLNGDALDGAFLVTGVMQASDLKLYGVAQQGGSSFLGALFSLKTDGTLFSVLANFTGPSGSNPASALFQHTNGLLYGVTQAGGVSGDGVVYSFNIGAAPFVKLSPTSGVEGSTVAIYGQGFTHSSTVTFGGVSATTVSFVGASYLTAVVPPGALTGLVTVTTAGVPVSSLVNFNVLPTISNISPTSGICGTAITVTGTGLLQAKSATVGKVNAGLSGITDTQVTVTVLAGDKAGNVRVTDFNGFTAKSTKTFDPTPVISSFSPTSGHVGIPVMITGTCLTQTNMVTFGGVTSTSVTVNSDTQVTATVPTGAITGKIVVTRNGGGTATSATNFTVN